MAIIVKLSLHIQNTQNIVQRRKQMKSSPEKILKKHKETVHSEMKKVLSHVQRQQGEWLLNSLMIEGCGVPFKYKRKKAYKDLKGKRVNLTYYPATETIAGIDFEIMKVVRIKIA